MPLPLTVMGVTAQNAKSHSEGIPSEWLFFGVNYSA
jgi:hypothetical protein